MFKGLCVLILLLGVQYGDNSDCFPPDSWHGSWFLKGYQEPVIINSRRLGQLGQCHVKHGDKFVLYKPSENCFQCSVFWLRHENILEFKTGECRENGDDTESLCDISPDTSLNTLVRVDGERIKCPITAPATFSYDKGTGSCSSPTSEVSNCLSEDKVKLRFQACADIPQTESKGD